MLIVVTFFTLVVSFVCLRVSLQELMFEPLREGFGEEKQVSVHH